MRSSQDIQIADISFDRVSAQDEIDVSYVHGESALAVLRDFLVRFKARWPSILDGPFGFDLTVDQFIGEYRAVAR
jgi:hypothetical protein